MLENLGAAKPKKPGKQNENPGGGTKKKNPTDTEPDQRGRCIKKGQEVQGGKGDHQKHHKPRGGRFRLVATFKKHWGTIHPHILTLFKRER